MKRSLCISCDVLPLIEIEEGWLVNEQLVNKVGCCSVGFVLCW